jgi:magnesium chelatase family protein
MKSGEKSDTIRERVVKARDIQAERYSGFDNIYCNAQMNTKLLHQVCGLSDECNSILKTAMEKLGLSARAYDRILKVSRTIADLDGSKNICAEHLSEAIQYRSLDREGWAG